MASLLLFVLFFALFMGGAALSPGGGLANRLIALVLFIFLMLAAVIFAGGLFRALFGPHSSWARVS